MRLPSLKFLKTFHIAATRLSFKAAAEALFITPSAVSHQIRTLEEQLGVSLFVRGTRGLTLTAAGAAYFAQIDALFRRLESVTEQLQVRCGRALARLHVPPFFASELLLPRLRTFLEATPETDIELDTVLSPLRSHASDADLSIVVGTGPWDGLEADRLFSQRFTPACAPALLERIAVRAFADLSGQTLIVHEARRDGWERWAQVHGIETLRPGKLVRVDTMFAAAEAAEKGLGIALVSAPLGRERFASGALVRLFAAELDSGESYFLLHRSEDAARREVHALKQWLLGEFRLDT
ncbi:MAG TPA: LysR substrate-binding domain-containing protein [Steroidobacteraceae bacterium]|nr:LysR substrate-binding domain-containing protein [Steroidobacteraceae bacterium]